MAATTACGVISAQVERNRLSAIAEAAPGISRSETTTVIEDHSVKIPELPVKGCKKREGEGSSRGAKGLRSSEGSSRGSSWRASTECAAGQEPWIGKGGDGGAEQGTAQGSPLASTQGPRSARGAQRPPPLPQRRAQSWTQRRSQSRTQPKAQSRTDYSRSSRGHPLEGLGIGTGLHRLGEEMAAQGDTGKTQMDRRMGL